MAKGDILFSQLSSFAAQRCAGLTDVISDGFSYDMGNAVGQRHESKKPLIWEVSRRPGADA